MCCGLLLAGLLTASAAPSSSSLEKSRVAFAPVRGPIGAASAESALAKAQAAHARGAATLHPMLPWR